MTKRIMHTDHISRLVGIYFMLVLLLQQSSAGTSQSSSTLASANSVPSVEESSPRAIYSPLLDFNNVWTPIGHGDPLKKDPTYDYSPPMLERVRYWASADSSAPSSSGSDGDSDPYGGLPIATYNPHSNVVHKTKSDILLLGVSATVKRAAHFKSPETPPVHATSSSSSPQRRHFYAQLPTVLMPPPMQILNANNIPPRPIMSYQSQHTPSPIDGGHNRMQWMHHHQHHQPAADSYTQASDHYVSVVSTDGTSVAPTSVAPSPSFSPNHLVPASTTRRKPSWIHSLLQKEVTHSSPIVDAAASTATTTSHFGGPASIVSMVPSSAAFESHTHDFITPHTAPTITTHPPTVSTVSWHSNSNSATTLTSFTQPMPLHSQKLIAVSTRHPQLSNHIIETIPPMTWPETTTHFTPTVRPYMRPAATTQQHVDWISTPPPPPAYLIIEGHSKVKTYGGNASGGRHEPNVRTVQSTIDPVVVSATTPPPEVRRSAAYRLQLEENERRFEVRHLHYRQPPTPEQQADEERQRPSQASTTTSPTPTTTDSATFELSTDDGSSASRTQLLSSAENTPSATVDDSNDDLMDGVTTTTTEAPTTTTASPQSPMPTRMVGLLSLLDTSFGDLFADNDASPADVSDVV